MKVTGARLNAALDRPPADIRLYLLFGPDEAGAMALAERLARAMGPQAERVDLDPATLKNDPARLADEAASISLFGSAQYIRVVGAGEESVVAAETLLASEQAGNPVMMIAPSARATSKLAKLALGSDLAMAMACYVPTAHDAEAVAVAVARDHGLRLAPGVAGRVARAADGDRAVMAREIAKLALFLDAAPDRPGTADEAALDAIGADGGEAAIAEIVESVIAGNAADLAAELRRMTGADTSPIPWLRGLARRLASLAEMRAEVDAGADAASVVKRHGVFFKEAPATERALRRWTPVRLAAAQRAVRQAERAVMSSGGAGRAIADQRLVGLARG